MNVCACLCFDLFKDIQMGSREECNNCAAYTRQILYKIMINLQDHHLNHNRHTYKRLIKKRERIGRELQLIAQIWNTKRIQCLRIED